METPLRHQPHYTSTRYTRTRYTSTRSMPPLFARRT
jgi:hypothetical protein